MNYEQCMEYLDDINKNNGIVLGSTPVKQMLELLGYPEKATKIIHVAGTNGKGSVSTFLAYILSECGYKVGRYVSPVISCYTEMIQHIDKGLVGYITETEVAGYITTIIDTADDMPADTRLLTRFEIETVMALMAFRDWECDYAIVECGLGGEGDATNAIDCKEMCIFTSISKDHIGILGDNLSDIARDKSGILRNDVIAVSAIQQPEVSEVLENAAKSNNIVMNYCNVPDNCIYSIVGASFAYKGNKYSISLPGVYQPDNAALAIEAADYLLKCDTYSHSDKYSLICSALKRAVWPGRVEVLSTNPYVIIDGAHNLDAVKSLVRSINSLFARNQYNRIGIMGVFADKDVAGMVGCIKDVFDEIHTVTAPSYRGMDASSLANMIRESGMDKVTVHHDVQVRRVLEYVKRGVDPEEYEETVIIIFGSLSLYSGVI